MSERISKEIEMLQKFYEVDFLDNWILTRSYPLPKNMNWNFTKIDVCAQIPANYPAQAPYGIYVPSELRIGNQTPASNYQEVANNKPPFEGSWGLISWSIDGPWIPNQEIRKGANLLNFINSFKERFKMGRV